MIEVMKPAAPGENVIQAGEDIKKVSRVKERAQAQASGYRRTCRASE